MKLSYFHRYLMPALMLAASCLYSFAIAPLVTMGSAPPVAAFTAFFVPVAFLATAAGFWLLADLSLASHNRLLSEVIKARFDAYEQRLLARYIN